MKQVCLAVALVVILGLYGANGDIFSCVIPFMINASIGGSNCVDLRNATACVLKESGYIRSALDNVGLVGLVTSKVNLVTTLFGLTCDFDVNSLVEGVRREVDLQGVVTSSETPKDYLSATTMIGCVTVFSRHDADSLTCAGLISYIKCLLRVGNFLGLFAAIPWNVYQRIEEDIRTGLTYSGLSCDFHIYPLTEEAN